MSDGSSTEIEITDIAPSRKGADDTDGDDDRPDSGGEANKVAISKDPGGVHGGGGGGENGSASTGGGGGGGGDGESQAKRQKIEVGTVK